MKFLVAFKKDDQPLIRMVLDNDRKVWAETTEEVYTFAKNNFKENEICDFDYEEDEEGNYFVRRIHKKGKKTSGGNKKRTYKKRTSSKSSDKKYCACGAEITNKKYDQCYNCHEAGRDAETTEESTDDKKYCECGTEIKNPQYDKCYNCNKKDRTNSSSDGRPSKGAPYGSLTKEEAERRNKLVVLSSVCQAVSTTVAGTVQDVDTLTDMILVAFDKIYKKLF